MSLPEIVTLAEAKAHCRVTQDDEDALFEGYIATATETVMALADGLDASAEAELPASIRSAVLMHVATLYRSRMDGDVPKATATLARRYRDWAM